MAALSPVTPTMAHAFFNSTTGIGQAPRTEGSPASTSPLLRTTTVTRTTATPQHAITGNPTHAPMPSEWLTRRDFAAICTATGAVAFILGVLAMLVFARARRRAHTRAYEGQQHPHESSQLMGIDAAEGTRLKAGTKPSSVEDDSGDELVSALEQLGVTIQRHVEDSYVLSVGQHDRDGLVQAIAALPFLKHDARFLAHLCSAPATRHVAIRHLITVTVLSAVEFGAFHGNALLPPAVLNFWRSLRSSHGNKKYTEALWQWQKLSLFLLEKAPTSSKTPEPSDAIQPQVAKLRALLDPVLSTFAPDSHEERYRQSEQLEELIWDAARLGYRMLSHPCRWSFNWAAGDHEMALLPGLLRLSDARGEMLDRPLPVRRVVTVPV